ncbi:MAG: 16S rRNA (guanine(966)-N(2))-methyltransferase RsmD [Prolixibacteraceae bacterium]|jgi:16S rRNA (guanine966-N2)-methyltransferase|nr:16S rRNA (guanine(966)-N(2))-methyltransferase RsmD [Prolixibacteraceae bacterium]
MRIVGGKYKGRMFNPGKSFKARPTTDFAKESLFNIFQNRIDFDTIKVLDLFAGTGSISFEFISRGCTELTLIELNFKHIQFIKSTLKELNEVAKVYRADAFKFISSEKGKYDLIFADPPYDHPRFEEVAEMVLKNDLLSEEGLFILEHPKNFSFSKYPEFFELRKYGSVHFSFFKKLK